MVVIHYLFIRAVADTKRNSEPITKIVSYCKRIILRSISSKLVFLYHDLLSLKALQLLGLYPLVRSFQVAVMHLGLKIVVKKDQY